jgi:hypothetical protein
MPPQLLKLATFEDAVRAAAWMRDVPAINIIGFSLTGYGDPSSGKLLEDALCAAGWTGTVREISYGGLSINALAGLIQLAAKPIQPSDIVVLELATSFFSLHKYTLDQARPLVFAIANHFARSGSQRVLFLNLFRADLDDEDCVVRAISEASHEFCIPILDLKAPFRKLSYNEPFGTTDGIHPDVNGRQMIAGAITHFLASGPWDRSRALHAPVLEYSYLDLVPLLKDLPRHKYSARGKCIIAAVAPAEFLADITLTKPEHVVGYCFLYGPETGFIEVAVGTLPSEELITFDENSYYRRIGFRPLDKFSDRLRLHVPRKVRDIALVHPTNLLTEGRCEFICGLIVKRATQS